jgi:hypothetical protein
MVQFQALSTRVSSLQAAPPHLAPLLHDLHHELKRLARIVAAQAEIESKT